MLQPLRLIGFVLALAVECASPAVSRAADAPSLPFTLSWTHGICSGCQTAKNLGDVQFVSSDEAWGIGYVAPGETGTGDYSILHTRDGGKTWTELPSSYQHNDPPRLSFSSQRRGWVMIADVVAAEQRLLQTSDGGAHWSRLPLRDWFVRDIQYLGGSAGYAYSFDIYAKQTYLFGTRDGRHWSKSALPDGFSADRMMFVNAREGLLAGCLDHEVTVVRTSDGGWHWEKSQINLPPAGAMTKYCDFEVDDLSLLNARQGWLLSSKHVFKLGDERGIAVVSRTSDAGATWTPAFQATFPVTHAGFTGVQFLDERIGFISKYETLNDRQASQSKPKGTLLYTTDGGRTWQQTELPRPVEGCHPYSGVLMCAAASSDFWVLRISRASGP